MLSLSWQFVLWWWLFPPWHSSKLDSISEIVGGRCTVLGELSSLLVQDPRPILCHWSGSETTCRQVWSEADDKTGNQAVLAQFCRVGEELRGGQIAVCWRGAMPLVGERTWSAVWVLCWKRLAPVRSPASSSHPGELTASWHVPPAVETPQGWSTFSDHCFFIYLFISFSCQCCLGHV